MKQDQFCARYEEQWAALEHCLQTLEPGSAPDGAPLGDFPRLYRQLCQHLALARRRSYSRGLIDRLHRLVLRAHHQLYGHRRRFGRGMVDFISAGFPRLVRSHWRYVLASSMLFFGPLLALIIAIQVQPEIVYTVMDPATVAQMEAMYDPAEHHRVGRERAADSDVLMFGYYIKNNTSIGFQTFAGGLTFGLLTAVVLLFNGLFIGAAAGHLTAVGHGGPFWSFVAGHSAFELTAITLSGAAGLRLGMALLAPGRMTRRRAIREAARAAVRIVYGAAGLFLAAAFVEAFWSSIAWIEPTIKHTVGVVLWILTLGYLILGGRGREARGG